MGRIWVGGGAERAPRATARPDPSLTLGMTSVHAIIPLVRHLAPALLFTAACTSMSPAEVPLRVMSYNIRLDLASDGPNAWPHRKDAVAGLITSQRADLVGVQEALPVQLSDLDERLPQFGRFGVGRAADRSGEYSAVFYRRDRFDVLRQDTFWLSETPDVAGSRGWDAAHERIATWGQLRDKRSGQVFFVFNTHLDHVGEVARREGTRLLLARISELAGDHPVILTGDFNAAPDSEPYGMVIAGGLRDAMLASRGAHVGPTSTWNGFRAIEPQRRIDFVFVRGAVDVLEHEIADDMTDQGRFPSDHLPVIAEVAIGR